MAFLWIIAGLLLFLILFSAIEQRFLTVSEYTVISGRLDKEQAGFLFVLIADLHNCSYGKSNQKLKEKIDSIKPDFIVMAGDMVTKRQKCFPGNAYSLVRDLAGRYQIYYSIGNHEQYYQMLGTDMGRSGDQNGREEKLYASWTEFVRNLSDMGVIFLDNDTIIRNQDNGTLQITGISIDSRFYGKGNAVRMEEGYLDDLVGKKPAEGYVIAVAHNPVYFNEYIRWGSDLILSGHVHGGLIRLPHIGGVVSPQYNFFPKYDAGIFTENDQSMIVSRGLGSHSFMPRLFNRPELVSVRIINR